MDIAQQILKNDKLNTKFEKYKQTIAVKNIDKVLS